MDKHPKPTLFLIRLWADNDTPGARWHGRIHPIGEGQPATFNDWPTLQTLIQELLFEQEERAGGQVAASINSDEHYRDA